MNKTHRYIIIGTIIILCIIVAYRFILIPLAADANVRVYETVIRRYESELGCFSQNEALKDKWQEVGNRKILYLNDDETVKSFLGSCNDFIVSLPHHPFAENAYCEEYYYYIVMIEENGMIDISVYRSDIDNSN